MASAGLSTLRLRTPRAAAIAGVRMDQKRIARFCIQYLLHQGSLGRNDVQAHMNLVAQTLFRSARSSSRRPGRENALAEQLTCCWYALCTVCRRGRQLDAKIMPSPWDLPNICRRRALYYQALASEAACHASDPSNAVPLSGLWRRIQTSAGRNQRTCSGTADILSKMR